MNHLAKKAQKLFVDKIIVKAQGGTGGHGLPKYGGIGGRGGDVCVVGSRNVKKLEAVLKNKACKAGWFKAPDGLSALRTRLMGEPGQDLELKVPLGVTVEDSDGQVLGEIDKSKDKIIIALGGRGGDKFNDNQGFQGQKRVIKLDLKMISDAVLVGFPNAGKSSLLGAISAARPRVAEFPFTTLRPYLGTVDYSDYRSVTVADLPGLVEGAHKNLGLGHEFLKHIVRSQILIFLLDINPIDLGPSYPSRTTFETLCILNKEIELYDDTLLDKPALLAVSKVDSFTDSDHMGKYNNFVEEYETKYNEAVMSSIPEELRPTRLIKFDRVIPVSSKQRLGIGKFKEAIREIIDKHEEAIKLERDNFSTYEELLPLENNRLA